MDFDNSTNTVYVIIPTLDNHKTITPLIQNLLDYNYSPVVVDDGSNPPLKHWLKNFEEKIAIITHKVNQGKGASLQSGAKYVANRGARFFVTMDADGQHLVSEISKLLEKNDNSSIVIGARNFCIENVPFGSKFGRWFSNFWATLDTSQKITDSLSGFRLYPITILDLHTSTTSFDWEMEILVKHAWEKRAIKETSIECFYPKPQERVSHFKKFTDTMKIVVVHVKLLPLRVLLLKGFI
ncbi:MAG: glycosyltransferase family 2 protein [Campylobacterales bacterium]